MPRQKTLAALALTGAGAALLVGGVGAAATPSGVGADEQARRPAPRAIASRPTTRDAWTARVLLPVVGRAAPRRNAKSRGRIDPVAAYNRSAQVLLVLAARSSRKHGVWYKVRLPRRPNDASAWVPANSVRVTRTRWRIKVDVSQRVGELYRGGKRIGRWKVVVGTPSFPTPTGRFAISEVVPQRRASGFFGPAIITMTAHSERLNFFDGGDGRAALHGTSRPSLLGRAASHGCVRFSNGAVSRIARSVPPGTPLDIVA